MIAIPPRKPQKTSTADKVLSGDTLIDARGTSLDAVAISDIFYEMQINPGVGPDQLKSLNNARGISAALFKKLQWLLDEKRFEDLTDTAMDAFRLAAQGRAHKPYNNAGLSQEHADMVREILGREPAVYMHGGRAIKRGAIDQMALVFHLYRMGALTQTVREAFKHDYASTMYDEVRRNMREFYQFRGASQGWRWSDDPEKRNWRLVSIPVRPRQ